MRKDNILEKQQWRYSTKTEKYKIVLKEDFSSVIEIIKKDV